MSDSFPTRVEYFTWVKQNNFQYDLIAYSRDRSILQLVPSSSVDYEHVFNIFCLRFYFVRSHYIFHEGVRKKAIIASHRITALKAFFRGSGIQNTTGTSK